MPLDTKYRPGTFDDVVGQDVVVSILKAIVLQKKFTSAYMFSGPSGVGKTTLGRIFSKAVLCEATIGGNPCGTCSSCKSFSEEKHFGYRELDAASFGGKEDMVRLRDDAAFLSLSNKKIILLDECHDISKQGQDALLKQVEQCPPHLIYIFCTTEPEKVKPTLRKRCSHFQVSCVDSDKIFERLKQVCSVESIQFDEEALKVIAYRARGHVRDSLKYLEEASYLGPINTESVQKVIPDYSQHVFYILSNLGGNLSEALTACKKLGGLISVKDLYDEILSLVTDAVKLLYGFDDFIPSRRDQLIRLRDIHGSNLIEFMNYLLTRDKFVDKVGLQSDIILLHYKFCSNGFKPVAPVTTQVPSIPVSVPEISPIPVSVQSDSSSNITHAQLSKMSIVDRSKALRSTRNQIQNGIEKEEPQKVPLKWSLPKEERQGTSSLEEEELTSLEFSRLLVGGRGGGI